jgi:hypothetical protein
VKIVVESNPKLQADYFCFVAQDAVAGRFQKGEYLVLPYLTPTHPKSVFLPDLHLPLSFWNHFPLHTITDYHHSFPQKLTSQLHGLLLPTSRQLDQLTHDLSKLKITNQLTSNISTLTILPTVFGTAGSFSYQKIGQKYHAFISQRLDFPITNILRTLTQVQLNIKIALRTEVGEINWWKRQSIGDYLTGIFPAPGFSSADLIASSHYLKKLNLNQDVPHTTFAQTLSSQELKLWLALSQKSGEIISFDEAGTCIWESDADGKFSLYSLAKIVESLRRKLSQSGYNPRILQTIRKRGYLLTT